MRLSIEAGDWPLQAPGIAIFSVLVQGQLVEYSVG